MVLTRFVPRIVGGEAPILVVRGKLGKIAWSLLYKGEDVGESTYCFPLAPTITENTFLRTDIHGYCGMIPCGHVSLQ